MDEVDYDGPATLVLEGRELAVSVRLLAVTQPVDGRTHWSGRVAADPELSALLGGAAADAELVTPGGRAAAKVGEPDPWGRYRVTGVGAPPFAPEPVEVD
jgi:hypothetical protein